MHSSRMRTARLLPVSHSMHCSRGVSGPGGCTCLGVPGLGSVPGLRGGVYLPRGVYLRGVPGPGGYLPRYSPCGQTDTCKNITFANFVPGGVYLVTGEVYLVLGGVPGPGGYLVWGCTWSGGVPAQVLTLWTDRHM